LMTCERAGVINPMHSSDNNSFFMARIF